MRASQVPLCLMEVTHRCGQPLWLGGSAGLCPRCHPWAHECSHSSLPTPRNLHQNGSPQGRQLVSKEQEEEAGWAGHTVRPRHCWATLARWSPWWIRARMQVSLGYTDSASSATGDMVGTGEGHFISPSIFSPVFWGIALPIHSCIHLVFHF